MAEFSAIISTKKFFLNKLFGYYQAYDIVAILISLSIIYLYYNSTKGVYIKERQSSFSYFFIRILKGEFRDNPVLNFFISIIASIIGALLMNLFND